MARIRAIKPEFWSSPNLPADPWTRLLYIAMWNWADDTGVGTANEREMLGFAFPNDHQIDTAGIRRMYGGIRRDFGVKFYTVAGRPYYAIPSWREHQKFDSRGKGKHPGPELAETWLDLGFPENTAESAGLTAGTRREHGAGTGEIGTGEIGNRNRGGAPLENPASPPSPFCIRHQQTEGTEQACRGCKYAAADRERWEQTQLTPSIEYLHEHRWLDDDTCMTCTERRF